MSTPGPDAILSTLRSATTADVRDGKAWYPAAHTFAHGLADEHGIRSDQAAGIIAALSPQQAWGSNMRAAETLCRTGDSWGFPNNRGKAMRILNGEAPENVLGGNKVRSFYFAILFGGDTDSDAVIDRHAADIALGRSLDAKPLPSGYISDRRYRLMSDAYRIAAQSTPYTVHELQAITWVARRHAKHPNNPDAYDR